MRKLISIIITLLLLSGCGNTYVSEESKTETNEIDTSIIETNTPSLKLAIDDIDVETYWLDNESVTELKRISTNGLTIKMQTFSTFEQFGDIGYTLPSDDKVLTMDYGDIALYQSNILVIFYDINTSMYTKLGHINLRKTEMKELLSENDVTVTLKYE